MVIGFLTSYCDACWLYGSYIPPAFGFLLLLSFVVVLMNGYEVLLLAILSLSFTVGLYLSEYIFGFYHAPILLPPAAAAVVSVAFFTFGIPTIVIIQYFPIKNHTRLLQEQNLQLQEAYQSLEQIALQLEKRNKDLLELSQAIDTVAENERGSIAHELHDAVVNPFETQLTLLKSKLDSGLTAPELEASYLELTNVRHHMREGLLNLHAAELKVHGLYTAIVYMIKRLSKGQAFTLHQHISDSLLEQPLTQNMEHSIYRITQQALQNVIKHAEASNVTIYLDFKDTNTLLLEINDDGKGFEVPADFAKLQAANHNGLAGFAQKVKLLGGQLHIESTPGTGTAISIELPVST
jgi:signal transduction histidine kinase